MNNDKIHSPWFLGYLMLTAVLSGGFVMLVEVLGSRVVGPFFGIGLFVWTSLIAVALFSLALGYWLAGHWADKREHPDYLYGIIIVAGLLVLTIPLLKGPVLQLCMPLGLRWGAFISTLILFGPVLFVLGCVSPYLIKVAAQEFHLIGRTVGRFSALSTLGSMVGTTATGFFLIAHFDVNTIFAMTGGVLIALSAIYFAAFRRIYWPLLLLIVPLLAWQEKQPLNKVLESGTRVSEVADLNSYYGHIKVVDYRYQQHHVRDMLIDGLTQGGVDMVNRLPLYEYAYLMKMLPYGLQPEGKRALMIGLGGGMIPMWYEQRGVTTDVVEIDPVVVEVAQKYFDFRIRGDIYVNDARYFLTTSQRQYDYILLDVFNGDLTPSHLMSVEAFELARQRLTAGGVFAVNLIADIQQETASTHSIIKTLQQLFSQVAVYPVNPVESGNTITNVLVIAYNGAHKPLQLTRVQDTAIYPAVRQNVFNSITHPQPLAPPQRTPIVVRDDFNPLDTWDSATRETVRMNILSYQEMELLIN